MTELTETGTVHFVAIGGAGMSGIARILLARGRTVSGSDARPSRALDALAALGATVHVGHDASQVGPDVTAVVASTAVRASNVELVEARGRGIPVLRRAEALAAVMIGSRGVAVAGTHGKTTTTSLLTVALQHCGTDPSFAIGGDLGEAGSNAHHGAGDVFVAEADESDGSFLLLDPFAAIVTNVEADHLDNYGSLAAVEQAFVDFVGTIAGDGFLVACADDPGSQALAEHARATAACDVRTYGTAPDADLVISDVLLDSHGGSSFRATVEGVDLPRVQLRIPGIHNIRNACAALLVALGLDVDPALAVAGLASFTGVRRRFELKGVQDGVRVVDDYAHHPTEVAATLTAARLTCPDGRLIVAFQPHLYSRTLAFAAEFGEALALADEVVVMDVYAAREEPVPGVTGATIGRLVPLPGDRVHVEPSWSAVAPLLASIARRGDLVMTVGAGDVTLVGPEVLATLAAR